MPRHLTQKQKSLLDEHRYAAKPEDIPRSAWEALEQLNDFERKERVYKMEACRLQ